MDKAVEERFERIESALERVGERLNTMGERMDQLTEAHIEIEAAQKNTTVLLNRFIDESNTRGKVIDERIGNLAILVNQLIKRDMNGGR